MFIPFKTDKAPPAVRASVITIEQFRGADLTGEETGIDLARSPHCPNMIRSSPGKVRKRMGYEPVGQYGGCINGLRMGQQSVVDGSSVHSDLVHAGTKLYINGKVVADNWADAHDAWQNGTPIADTGLADAPSCWVGIGDGLRLLDGQSIRHVRMRRHAESGDIVYYCPRLSDFAYIPTVMISRDPSGGGTAFEEVNLLADGWREDFYATADDTDYQLSFGGLSEAAVEVEIMGADGESWQTLTEGSDFTVDRTTGTVSFITPPGVSPVEGSDNIRITARKDRSEGRSRIDRCTVGFAYTGSATGARLFVTGNPDYPNRDFWSALGDTTYFPDINYSRLGADSTAIVGYSLIGDSLAAHKENGDIYVRRPDLDEDGWQQFAITNIIKGPDTLAPRAFAHLNGEPLFLTSRGVYALTVSDLTDERYAQRRSYYLDGALLREPGLSEASACVFKDFYVLSVGDKLYILDSSTKSFQKHEPYAAYQYEGFYFTDIPAICLYADSSRLWFGTRDGGVYRFHTNPDTPSSYNDDGAPIEAAWQTPEIDGTHFYKNKSFKRIAVRFLPSVRTGVCIDVRKRGVWSRLFEAGAALRYLDFRAVDFGAFSFSTDATAHTCSSKIKVKKVDKAAFRLSNALPDSPFEPDAIALEYTENGNYKG